MNKEKVIEHIKYICDNSKKANIDFTDLKIEFELDQQKLFRNQIVLHNVVKIANKNDNICFRVSGDVDEKTLAKYAIGGYIEEREIFLKEKAMDKFMKEHPILYMLGTK